MSLLRLFCLIFILLAGWLAGWFAGWLVERLILITYKLTWTFEMHTYNTVRTYRLILFAFTRKTSFYNLLLFGPWTLNTLLCRALDHCLESPVPSADLIRWVRCCSHITHPYIKKIRVQITSYLYFFELKKPRYTFDFRLLWTSMH